MTGAVVAVTAGIAIGVGLLTWWAVAPVSTRSWRAGGWGMLLVFPSLVAFVVLVVASGP